MTDQSLNNQEFKDFCCPICSSSSYEQLTQSSGVLGGVLGGRGQILLDYHMCLNCSVIFKDAKKFSKT